MVNKLKNSPYSMQSSTMVNQRVKYGNMTIVYSIFLTTHAGCMHTHTTIYTLLCMRAEA